MKQITTLILFIALFLLTQCKKDDADSGISVNDTTYYFTGFTLMTDSEFQSIPLATPADTIDFPVLGRISHQNTIGTTSSYILPDLPPHINQGPYFDCVAAVVANAISYHYQYIERTNAAEFEPLFLYSKSDKSTGFFNIFEASKTYGCAKKTEWPVTPFSWPFCKTCEGVVPTPNDIAERKAMFHRVTEVNSICNNRSELLTNTKFWLNRNYPVLFAMEVGDGFQNTNNKFWTNNIYHSISGSDTDKVHLKNGLVEIGKHAMLIIGFDDSKHAYRVQNSWDDSWGEHNGYCWIDYDAVNYALIGQDIKPQAFIIKINSTDAINYYLTEGSGRDWHWDPSQASVNCCGIDYELNDLFSFVANGDIDYDSGPSQSCQCDNSTVDQVADIIPWDLTINTFGNIQATLNFYPPDNQGVAVSKVISKLNTDTIEFSDHSEKYRMLTHW